MMTSLIARRAAGLLGLLGFGAAALVHAQSTSRSPLDPPPNGPRKVEPATVTLTGVTVHPRPGKSIADATVVMRDGKIVDVAPRGGVVGAPPAGLVRDGRGLHVYAGFIEPLVEVQVPKPDVNAPGSHYNSRVTPQRSALDKGSSGIDDGTAGTLRSLGFCAAGIAPRGGVFKGLGAVVSLGEKPKDVSAEQPHAYLDKAFHSIALDAGRGEDDDTPDDARWTRYPSSQMGAIAAIRQTLIDADWQAGERKAGRFSEPVNALDALAKRGEGTGNGDGRETPLLINAEDELEVLRAAKIAAEFGRPLIVLGSGQEFQRLDAIAAAKVPLVLPLSFPPAPKVEGIGQAESVGLRELMQWEQAPTNPRRVAAAGIPAALTSGKIDDKMGGRGSFMTKLSTAVKHGLSKDQALAMLTTGPAAMLGVADRLGTIEVGKVANLVLADGELFTDVPDAPKKGEPGFVAPGRPGKIIEVYIDGRRHVVGSGGRERRDLAGTWAVEMAPKPADTDTVARTLEMDDSWPPEIALVHTTPGKPAKEGEAAKPEIKRAKAAGVAFAADPAGDLPSDVRFTIDQEPLGRPGVMSFAGRVVREGETLRLVGDLRRPDGSTTRLTATRTGDVVEKDKKGPLDGTWTRVGGGAGDQGRPGKPGPESVHFVIGGEKKIQAKRGESDLKTEVVKSELDGESPRAELNVTGIDPAAGEAVTKVVITGGKDAGSREGRLTGTIGEGETVETVVLGRYRETPEADAIASIPERLGLPFGPYAYETWPTQGAVIIRGATIWTSAAKGPAVIEKGTIVLGGGTIGFIGTAEAGADYLSRVRLAGPVTEIDGAGLHVTPGIIDAHSHTGISKGVNEGGQAVTAEVRIGDVTDPDSVSWYRQLAGGVTAVNNLHGSANAIGGQNQVNKNRWGCPAPDDMHFAGAIGGIKFALGENPKQSNWGDRAVTRYPQTRMGVETIIRDRFVAAREYGKARSGGSAGTRRDLELEAVAEILEGKRLVHCHSYRQDEMLMLCRIAGEFGFKIGSFQHALEGYKVADECAKASLGSSMFSDWWAYKVEVQDAIPQCGPIMHERGNVVSYNSDSDELARRLNVEAGKAVRYAGSASTARLEPAEALKFVTINPAIQLGIEKRTGSLEAGKDADVAVWNGPPTSSLSRCVRTFVDGRELFSLEKDAAMRAVNERERARLIQKALGVKDVAGAIAAEKAGGEAKPDRTRRESLMERMARQAEDVRREHYLNLYLRGLDPRFYRSGDCGCDLFQMMGN